MGLAWQFLGSSASLTTTIQILQLRLCHFLCFIADSVLVVVLKLFLVIFLSLGESDSIIYLHSNI